MRLDDRDDRAAAERPLTGQHFVEHHAEAVQIAARIHRRTFRLLGADVVRRAAHFTRVRDAAVLALREAEVDQHDAAVLAHHHVRRFQVAMAQPGAVHDDQRAGDLQEDVDAVLHRHQIADAQLQAAAREVFGDDVAEVLGVAPVVHVDDRRMLQAHQQVALALEALFLAGGRLGQRTGAQHLDGDVVPELLRVRDVDLGLRRTGDRLQEAVAGDHRERRGLRMAPAAGLLVADVLHALPRG